MMEQLTQKQQDFINELLNDTHNHYEGKMKKVYEENKHLRRANSKQKQEIRHLKRVIKKKKQHDKQHYKNGKRGTFKNGG